MDAIYARQSMDKPGSLSIDGQIELCKKFTDTEPKVFRDHGFSGKNTNRPAFTALMEAVEAGEVTRVVVYRLDRFSRSIADFSRIWEKLEQHGVQFQSVSEQFDTSTPMGRAMLHIIMVFAQLERETTGERVADNYRHRFRLGAWPGGPAPFGFDLCRVTDDEGRRVSSLIANEQAPIVRDIFTAYATTDISLRGLARQLTEKEIHGPKRQAWDSVTVARILRSPAYVRASEDVFYFFVSNGLQVQQTAAAFDGIHGCITIGRRDRSHGRYNKPSSHEVSIANHEGIVEADLWLRAQEKLAQNIQISRAKAGKYSWLTGLLKCGKCGYAVKVNNFTSENRLRLICSGRSNLACCDATIGIDLRELEESVGAEIKTMLANAPLTDCVPESRELADAILSLDRKIDRLVDALAASDDIAAPRLTKKISQLEADRQALLEQAADAHHHGQTSSIDFDSLTFDEKKLVAHELIERVQLQGTTAKVIWRV